MFSRGPTRALIFTATVLLAASAGAQTGSVPNAPKDQNAPEHFDSQAQRQQRSNETLSDRLNRSGGVIRPPEHVDPEIHEAPPPTGDRGIVIPGPNAPNRNPMGKPK